MRKTVLTFLVTSALLLQAGCVNPPVQNSQPVIPTSNISYGLIQQNVVKGATKDQVVGTLGSPNMITNSAGDEETWIYDKVSTDYQNESGASSASVLGGGIAGAIGLGGSASTSSSSNRGTSSQRTLTLIIKFKKNVIDTFAVRTTSF